VTVAEKHPPVLLASMPFASYKQPSLALSLFKAILAEQGIEARVHYFTLDCLEVAGPWLYDKIATWHLPDLLGDWLFAPTLFPGRLPGWEEYVENILEGGCREHRIDHFGKEPVAGFLLDQILALREETPAFLARCVEVVAAQKPRLLALTSGVHQHGASLALARAVKEALPHTFIVLGGTNCTGVMGRETARQFPFLDAVVAGEGERVFPALVARVLAGKPLEGLPGVFGRGVRAERNYRGTAGGRGPEEGAPLAGEGGEEPLEGHPPWKIWMPSPAPTTATLWSSGTPAGCPGAGAACSWKPPGAATGARESAAPSAARPAPPSATGPNPRSGWPGSWPTCWRNGRAFGSVSPTRRWTRDWRLSLSAPGAGTGRCRKLSISRSGPTSGRRT